MHSYPCSLRALCSIKNASPSTTNNYNHLIQNLCKQGRLTQALHLLPHEPHNTQRTFEALILACTALNSPSHGAAVHRRLSGDGSDQDPFLATKLVNMYSSFGALDDARNVFDRTRDRTIFLWNAFLRALALADEGEEVLSLVRRMGVPFDSFTYSYSLKACVASSSLPSSASDRVGQLHGHAIRHGLAARVHVATTLLDCYAKLGRVSCSRTLFDEMLVRNVVSWSAMIACYARNESPFEALRLFREMTVSDPLTLPNSITMVSVLQACASLAALAQGRLLHAFVLRRGLDCVLPVANALIAMYMKCGCIELGRRVFDRLGARRDVVSWNSVISGYGIHGYGTESIRVFEDMVGYGISPSSITFVSVLGACSHVGLVQEGKRLFDSMVGEYGITPQAEHYACMVDLLGRADLLDEAAKIVEGMRIEPGPTVWGALLGACRIHTNVDLAERACARLFVLEPMNAGNYALLANIYADAKMSDKVVSVRKLVEVKGLQKVPGCSWIEAGKELHSFLSIDETNPRIEQLHALLVRLVGKMKDEGYAPNTKVVLYDLEEEEKERILLGHSEKLALAFGLINAGNRGVVRITNNLRLCEDCHSFTKFVSKFAKREILVRDVNRFHHFRDGVCSCSDYW